MPSTVVARRDETDRVRTFFFECPKWGGHLPGQHVDIRLTAADGYQAQRSYSIASAPSDDELALTIECLQDGEVSSYIFDGLAVGDQLEMRGPIGRYFVWDGDGPQPVLLIAGGSGVVPFRSMLRHRKAKNSRAPMRLLYSARSQPDIVYRSELDTLDEEDGVDVRYTLTRESPPGWTGYAGRIDQQILSDVVWPHSQQPATYVCGPTGFVEVAASKLVDLGFDPGSIKTERFG